MGNGLSMSNAAVSRGILVLLLASFAAAASAAPPSCKTVTQGDSNFRVCERAVDIDPCVALLKESPKVAEDPNWNGCLWVARFITGSFTIPGAPITYMHVSFVASYRNSERMDITMDVERSDHSHRKYVYADVPVVLENGLPTASVDFLIIPGEEPLGVPTAEMTEKGGSRTMSHGYK
jgi:hypothetical protein